MQIQKSEWRWVAWYAILLSILLSVPYVIGFAAQTSTYHFSGALIGADDMNTYFAKMNQGAHGAWLFTLPYSSEPHPGAPLYLFYLLLGKISGESFVAKIIVYHLTRIFFVCAVTFITYRFQAEFLPKIDQRRLALVIVTLGGGFGWLLVLFNLLPLEFYSPEVFSFLMLFTSPHLLAARCLLLLALLAFLAHRNIWAGLILLPLSLIQPAVVVIVWTVIGLARLLNLLSEKDFSPQNIWKNFRPVLVVVLVSAPLVLYLGNVFLTNSILLQWNLQGNVPSPHPLHYLSAYGIYAALAYFGIKPLKRTRPDLWQLVLGWTLLVPILLNIPIGIQRRMIEGYQIPLVTLAVLGLTGTLYAYRRWLVPLVLSIVVLSSTILWGGAIQAALARHEPFFRHTDELAAFDWLDKHGQDGQVVLSALKTGNAIPAYTKLIAFLGHPFETVFYKKKSQQAAEFYNNATPPEKRLEILKTGRIAYVLYGPHEQDLGTLDAIALPYLVKRFQQGNYIIYQVVFSRKVQFSISSYR